MVWILSKSEQFRTSRSSPPRAGGAPMALEVGAQRGAPMATSSLTQDACLNPWRRQRCDLDVANMQWIFCDFVSGPIGRPFYSLITPNNRQLFSRKRELSQEGGTFICFVILYVYKVVFWEKCAPMLLSLLVSQYLLTTCFPWVRETILRWQRRLQAYERDLAQGSSRHNHFLAVWRGISLNP